jgi:two-component system, NtrC family, sensor kinase
MKLFILTLFFFTSVYLKAQNVNADLPIGQMPKEGISLMDGWKFHSGHDSRWSNPNFNDSLWQPFTLNQGAFQFFQTYKEGNGWLRLHLSFDSAVLNTPMALLIEEYGASEVYLDGQLIERFGDASSRPIIPFNPHRLPIPLQITREQKHLLAIHFATAVPSSSFVMEKATVYPLSVSLQSTSMAIGNIRSREKEVRTQYGILYFNAGFGLLFLLIFALYPSQPLNLFFSLYNIFIALGGWLSLLLSEGHFTLGTYVWLQILGDYFGVMTGSSVMIFIALALYHRVNSFIKGLIIYTATIDFIGSHFFVGEYTYGRHFTHLAFTITFLVLTIKAFRVAYFKNWFIGVLAFVSFLINLNYFLTLIWHIDVWKYGFLFPLISLPSMTIYLAIKYAGTTASLEKQLVEVKNLSQENLRKEQEKQQILSTQKETLEKQVAQRTAELQNSFLELKATQAQLIQTEKMASLGELTAGIAHEIQNPLNFVNNFSEVSTELVDDMEDALQKNDKEEVVAIASDIKDNLQKIHQHRKRADAIVKGMLQHSRASSGKKEPADINALADEYLRLSYHGLRAKDKDFNATFKTNFDESVGKIEVVPQDVARVLLNLYNNAFYSVHEKKKQLNGTFEPTVEVTTKRVGDKVEIQVKDNGTGIPQKVVDKIFQPFFTTKPTGQGTGLGLSLSFDIIKAHGGEIKVKTEEGDGAEFIIALPA